MNIRTLVRGHWGGVSVDRNEETRIRSPGDGFEFRF